MIPLTKRTTKTKTTRTTTTTTTTTTTIKMAIIKTHIDNEKSKTITTVITTTIFTTVVHTTSQTVATRRALPHLEDVHPQVKPSGQSSEDWQVGSSDPNSSSNASAKTCEMRVE